MYGAGQEPESVRCTIGLAPYTVHPIHRTLASQGTSYQEKANHRGSNLTLILLYLSCPGIALHRSIRPPKEQQLSLILIKRKNMPHISLDLETRAVLGYIFPLAIPLVEQQQAVVGIETARRG